MKFHAIILLILFNQIFSEELFTEKYNITVLEKFKCADPIKDCNNNGRCNDNSTDCDCFEGYTTYFEDKLIFFSNATRCNYPVKSQLYALAFGLFVSFGSVHFYLGNYIVGYVQMAIFLIVFSVNMILIVKLSFKHLKSVTMDQYKQSLKSFLIMAMLIFIFLFWYMFDLFMIIFNIYRDENNVILQHVVL
jgi:hypothetical protein